VEPLFIFGMAYFSYLVAELFHLSGIMAIVFCGITMKQYVEANISQKSHTTVKYFLKMASNASETIIFALLGLSTLDVHHHEWNGSFVFFTLVFCLLFRFLGVIILTWFANKKRVVKMDRVSQFVMGYGGIRGAVTYSLVILLDGRHVKGRNMMITAAIALILFTCFIQGVTIKPFVELLKVKRRLKRKPTLTEQMNEKLMDHVMAGVEDIVGFTGHNNLRDKFEYFDGKYLRPILMREPPLTKHSVILETFTKLNLKDAVDRVVAPQPPMSLPVAPREWTVAPVLMASPTDETRPTTGAPPPPLPEQEPSFPRVTDRYGHGEMDDDAMHDILEHNVFAPRQFAVYKRADIASESTVMGLDELKDVRRESTAHKRESNAAATAAAAAGATSTAAAKPVLRRDGDSSTSSPHIHRLEDINEHRSGRHHHHRHHHHRHHHSNGNAASGSRPRRRRGGDDRSPPNSLADESPVDSGASHTSQHSENHHHHHHHHPHPLAGDHRHHHHHHHHHRGVNNHNNNNASPTSSSLGTGSANIVVTAPSETSHNGASAPKTTTFHLNSDDDEEERRKNGLREDEEEEGEIEDSVIPDVLSKDEELPPSGHHHHVLRAIKSAYELPTPYEAEERKRRISANADDMLGNTATETTLPWRKDDNDVNSDQAAKSALVFRSQSHSTLHKLAAAAEDSNQPPSSFEALRSGGGNNSTSAANLSRPNSSHHLSSLGGGAGGGALHDASQCCGGSTSATAATSEAASTPEVMSLHHNDPIYSRHRASHGSRHEMSLQECQMALDVAVDEAENEAASPEDRAHLHHLADPKLMRKRGELFEWSQRHKAPKQNQEEEEHPFDRIHNWLQNQDDHPPTDDENFPFERLGGSNNNAATANDDDDDDDGKLNDWVGGQDDDDDDEEETARMESMLRSAEVSDNDDDDEDEEDDDEGPKKNVEIIV